MAKQPQASTVPPFPAVCACMSPAEHCALRTPALHSQGRHTPERGQHGVDPQGRMGLHRVPSSAQGCPAGVQEWQLPDPALALPLASVGTTANLSC